MNKKCARCDKTVYPIEELKCLDKVWHKQCFKCQACNMTLNMRNYKGFNKDPYCEAHIPKAKATTVAVTPELRRIAENTKLQSNVKYHAEFEKTKGKLTQVADDPETRRIKQNSQNISNVAYHGDLQKKAAMEQRRNINDNANAEDKREMMPPSQTTNAHQQQQQQLQQQQLQQQQHHHQQHQQMLAQQQQVNQQYSNMQRDIAANIQNSNAINNSPYSARQTSTVIYTSDRGAVNNVNANRQVGSIADFDPVNNYYGSLAPTHKVEQQQPRSSGRVYQAMYDYVARDRDEVSFLDGDLIVNCTAIDSGWMTGCVQRTGEVGMLPANYVRSAL